MLAVCCVASITTREMVFFSVKYLYLHYASITVHGKRIKMLSRSFFTGIDCTNFGWDENRAVSRKNVDKAYSYFMYLK